MDMIRPQTGPSAGNAPENSSKHPQTALILSGGGANGAYEVGVLKALLSGKSSLTDYRPLHPDILVGTSVGAFNCAFLTSLWDIHGPDSVNHLERFWLEDLAGSWQENGVFRLRSNPASLFPKRSKFDDPIALARNFFKDSRFLMKDGLRRGLTFADRRGEPTEQRFLELLDLTSLISTEPLKRSLARIDFAAVRRSSRRLKVAATNWTTGGLRIFRNQDLDPEMGPIALHASSAMPGVFPPVAIGGELFCDGSVRLNTPLSPAIHSGADVLHVIFLDPSMDRISVPRLPNSFDTLFRTLQIQWAAAYETDIASVRRINQALAAVEHLSDRSRLDPRDAAQLTARSLSSEHRRHRPLTIYRYRPSQAFDSSLGLLLNFSRERLEELIELGFEDTLRHNSEESGDVLPEVDSGLAVSAPETALPVADREPNLPPDHCHV